MSLFQLRSSKAIATTTLVFVSAAMITGFVRFAQGSQSRQSIPVDWLRTASHPLASTAPDGPMSDLAGLAAQVDSARVVGIGESVHGASEFLRLKHRLFRYLVESHRFTALAIEGNAAIGAKLNAYIQTGVGDPRQLLTEMGFWEWDNDEVAALIEWMRAFNRSAVASRRLKVYGIDTQFPITSLDYAVEYLRRHDARGAAQFAAQLEPLRLDRSKLATTALDFNMRNRFGGVLGFQALGSAGQQALFDASFALRSQLRERRSTLIAAAGADAWHAADDAVTAAIGGLQSLRGGLRGIEFQGEPRDSTMALLVMRVLDSDPGARLMVWAHNDHLVRTGGSRMLRPFRRVGEFLADRLGSRYVAVGLLAVTGAYNAPQFSGMDRGLGIYLSPDLTYDVTPTSLPQPGARSIEAAYRQVGRGSGWLNLREVPKDGPVRDWFSEPRAILLSQANLPLPSTFDILIALDSIQPSRLSPNVARILQSR